VRLLALLLLTACTQQPEDTQPIKLTLVANTAEVRQKCGNSPLEPYGCAKQNRSEINPGGSCEIVAIRPRGFDDHEAIKTLGHELYHCFRGPVHY
jgi:hypothetical protein